MTEETQAILGEIKIGEDTYTVRRFKGLKATIAASIVARVLKEIPELQQRATEARKQFRRDNTVAITRALARTENFKPLGLTDSDFDKTENGVIELPEEPPNSWMMIRMWPDIFELAQSELQRFLALMVISNSDLESADDADTVDETLANKGKQLMRKGDIDELLELMVVSIDVLREQMARKSDRLGKLQLPFLRMFTPPEEEEVPTVLQDETEPEPPPEMMEEPGSNQENPKPQESSPPDSFTDSPEPTDGEEEKLSTASPGTS